MDKITVAILYNAALQLRKKESFRCPTSSTELGCFHNMDLLCHNPGLFDVRQDFSVRFAKVVVLAKQVISRFARDTLLMMTAGSSSSPAFFWIYLLSVGVSVCLHVGLKICVYILNDLRRIRSFHPSHNEMAPCHVLKVINKEEVDYCAPCSTSNRNGLGGSLFGYGDSEA